MTTKELRTASVSVCPERDIECGDLQKQWCETCPKKNKELSKQEIKPVAFLRYKNGKIDWGEDCLAADKGYSIDCYDDNDDDVYTEVALYPESTVTALRTEIERLKRSQPNIGEMVNRFLGWRIPQSFSPDCGISFDGRKDDDCNKNKTWPTGTNVFNAAEAKVMFEYCLAHQAEPARIDERETFETWFCNYVYNLSYNDQKTNELMPHMKEAWQARARLERGGE